MKRCTSCFYAKRCTVATYEPVWTCLHPLSRSAVGYPYQCSVARQADGFCGPGAACFTPTDGAPTAAHVFLQ